MTSNVQLFLQHSLMFWLALVVAWLHLTTAMTVHLKYTSSVVKGGPMPDELNITLSGESGAPTYLKLRRIQHVAPNVPVYTLRVDDEGSYYQHLEPLEDKQNIGYYQDVSSEAVIQVTRIDGPGDNDTYYVLNGELNIRGKRFILSHDGRFKRDASSSSSSEDAPYSLLQQEPSLVGIHDYIPAPPEIELRAVESPLPNIQGVAPQVPTPQSASSLSQTNRSRRRRRQSGTVTPIFIDIVAVIDYACYRRFQARASTTAATLQAMREYYSFIFSGVDSRYQGIAIAKYPIRVRLIKLIIAETAATSTFTEQFRQSSTPWDEIDAQKALTAFSNFAAGSGTDVLYPYDHAMLITGYDMTSTQAKGGVSDVITGLAYTSTLCRMDGKSTSIVEDLGGFQCVDTAAHELGHSFSAVHDGDGNNCRSEDRFVMSAGGFPETQTTKLNPWLFSTCSTANFTAYLDRTLKTARGTKCLTEELSISGVPDVSSRLPGQEFSPDNQCRMIYGEASRLCRGFVTPYNICTSMFCYDPTTNGTCFGHKAAMGTTCGNGKICLNGKCESDPRAPAVDDVCVFGDQPGIAFQRKTCSEFVNDFNFYCDQSVVRDSWCCESCKAVHRDVPGCEYGDSVYGCTADHCRYATQETLRQCCGTCGPKPAAPGTGTSTNVRQPVRPTVGPSTRPTLPGRVRPAITSPTTASSSACEDNEYIQVNGQPCSIAISVNPSLCNTKRVKDACCKSCASSRQIRRGWSG